MEDSFRLTPKNYEYKLYQNMDG